MELAFVLLFVLLGVIAIVYAGLRRPPASTEGDATAAEAGTGPESGGDAKGTTSDAS